jgi:hypothetical protein
LIPELYLRGRKILKKAGSYAATKHNGPNNADPKCRRNTEVQQPRTTIHHESMEAKGKGCSPYPRGWPEQRRE